MGIGTALGRILPPQNCFRRRYAPSFVVAHMQREGSSEARSGDDRDGARYKILGGCSQIRSLWMDLLQSPEAPALNCRVGVRRGKALQVEYRKLNTN